RVRASKRTGPGAEFQARDVDGAEQMPDGGFLRNLYHPQPSRNYEEETPLPKRAHDMVNGQLGTILRHLCGLAAAKGTEGLSDTELLRRFCAGREETAFAALMQ